MRATYQIDDTAVSLDVDGDRVQGAPEVLVETYGDPLSAQPWFRDGFTVAPLLSPAELSAMRAAVLDVIRGVVTGLGRDLRGLSLEGYHKHVEDELHALVIAQTRRLPLQDFGVPAADLIARLSALVGTKLSLHNPALNADQWVICRINRPGSQDFNPVHKDAYEALDHAGMVPPMVNFWVPVCGVAGPTGLPVAPGSHLIPEDRIERTKAGCSINGRRYSVNAVTRWDGGAVLTTIAPDEGEVLAFSSNLIHGLGRNLASDTTRMALEFRLFAVD